MLIESASASPDLNKAVKKLVADTAASNKVQPENDFHTPTTAREFTFPPTMDVESDDEVTLVGTGGEGGEKEKENGKEAVLQSFLYLHS